jgi:hypothetical protein
VTRRSFAGHDLAHGLVIAGLEAQVAPGHNANHLATIADRKTGNPELLGQRNDLSHGVLGVMTTGSRKQSAFVALHPGDLGRLLGRREVLVHDADAAFLSNGNREASLRDRVHGRRDQGQVQANVAGELG